MAARTVIRVLALVAAWAVVAVPVASLVFLNSSRTTVLASHEAEISPNLDGWAVIDLGPVLPSFRYPSGGSLGADISLGKTSSTSFDELVQRYALLAGQPEGQIAKVEDAIVEMAVAAGLTGALAGLGVPGLWWLLGSRRRAELLASPRSITAIVAAAAVGGVAVAAVAARPWDSDPSDLDDTAWEPISAALPDVPIPVQARPLQVDATLLTRGTERLVESALSSYRTSSAFYDFAAEDAAALTDQLRLPEEDETVGLLVSDRHDNIGMDLVARAIADAGGATFLMDAGDDTSTGSSWEAFSLESLDEAFDDFDQRFFVAGNHDHGPFVVDQAADLGFTVLSGEVEEGPDGIRLLGVGDPRSSGLGNWRDESGLSFEEVEERLADTACAVDEEGDRISTVLVHDRNLGRAALERGCVDLVLAGHLHVIEGPTAVEGANGEVGYSYTTGSTGGAAYAIAIGTKPRRDAVVTLVTYRGGRPVGLQWVSLSPLGKYQVGAFTALPYEDDTVSPSEELGDTGGGGGI